VNDVFDSLIYYTISLYHLNKMGKEFFFFINSSDTDSHFIIFFKKILTLHLKIIRLIKILPLITPQIPPIFPLTIPHSKLLTILVDIDSTSLIGYIR
jgi:hypothetical protein